SLVSSEYSKARCHADTAARTATTRLSSVPTPARSVVVDHAGPPGVERHRPVADDPARGADSIHHVCGASTGRECRPSPYRRRDHHWPVCPPVPVAYCQHAYSGYANATDDTTADPSSQERIAPAGDASLRPIHGFSHDLS